MIILALDSAMNGCSVGVYDTQKGSLSSLCLDISRGQAEQLMPMVESALKEASVTYSEINLIAVTKGPGAFTGMRIGLATAKALGLSLDIPVVGVSTFKAILETYFQLDDCQKSPYYGVLLETKRQDYYFQMFDGQTKKPCSDKVAASAQDILSIIGGRDCIILGDATQRFENEGLSACSLSFYDVMISLPSMVAFVSSEVYKDTCGVVLNLSPVYLRSPDVSLSKKPPRKLK